MNKKDIKNEGGKCKKVATDFWECTDKDKKVWWCSDGGNACVEKPKVSMNIKNLEREGAECEQMADDLWICQDGDGKVWWCVEGGKTCGLVTSDSSSECGCSNRENRPHMSVSGGHGPMNMRISSISSFSSAKQQVGLGLNLGQGLAKLDCKISCGMCRDCFPWFGCIDYPCCDLSDCRIVVGKVK